MQQPQSFDHSVLCHSLFLEGTAENVIFPAGRASSFVQLDSFLQGKSQQSALKTLLCTERPLRTQGTKKKVLALNIVVCWL